MRGFVAHVGTVLVASEAYQQPVGYKVSDARLRLQYTHSADTAAGVIIKL